MIRSNIGRSMGYSRPTLSGHRGMIGTAAATPRLQRGAPGECLARDVRVEVLVNVLVLPERQRVCLIPWVLLRLEQQALGASSTARDRACRAGAHFRAGISTGRHAPQRSVKSRSARSTDPSSKDRYIWSPIPVMAMPVHLPCKVAAACAGDDDSLMRPAPSRNANAITTTVLVASFMFRSLSGVQPSAARTPRTDSQSSSRVRPDQPGGRVFVRGGGTAGPL
jgi:hypothetical protein